MRLALYYTEKSCSEVFVKDSVDDGVQCRVDVAQPFYCVGDFYAGDGALWTEGKDNVHEEEWKPADDEGTHNDGESTHQTALLGQ